MTLLITVFAAVISTLVWYTSEKARKLGEGILCYLYWGASMMWFVDAVAEYATYKEAYFTPTIEDMINDVFLGLSVIALGLVIWTVYMLLKDPKGVVKRTLTKTDV